MLNLAKSQKNHNKGFTLIEILIAAIILFSALAITAELYSASSLSANKASQKAHFYQIHPVAISAIKNQLRQLTENRALAEHANKFVISGIEYQWNARRILFKARAPDFDDFMPPIEQFGVFNVQVTASLPSSNHEAIKSENFQFEVATW